MKNLLYLIFVALIPFVGCGDDDSLSAPAETSVPVIQGKIENYKKGDYVYLTFFNAILANSPVKNDGSFSIALPDAAIYQFNFVGFPDECVISDPEANITTALLMLADGVAYKGYVAMASDSDAVPVENEGAFCDEFWYADREVTIKGHRDITSGSETVIYNYNLHLNRGWNHIRFRMSQNTSSKTAFQYESVPFDAAAKFYLFSTK